MIEALQNTISNFEDHVDFEKTCKKMGITWHRIDDSPTWTNEKPSAIRKRVGPGFKQLAKAQRVVNLRRQSQIGAPGTKIFDGRIKVEHNIKLQPFYCRGASGNTGIYEQTARESPILSQSLNHITALVLAASYEQADAEKMKKKHRKIADAFHCALMRIDSGFKSFLRDSATVAKMGFSPFEVVWQKKNGMWLPYDLQFREQSTVDKWLFDERQSKLIGAEFRPAITGLGSSEPYMLPHGDDVDMARLLLLNIYATGNNVEGVSVIRPAIGYHQLKKVVLQSFGVSYTRYGCPMPVVSANQVASKGPSSTELQAAPTSGDIQDLYDDVSDYQSEDVIVEPPGMHLRYENPTNNMPDPVAMLEYLDTMMAIVASNEGMLLGQQSAVGSYALASVSDNKFMRSAPVYTEAITDGITKLLHWTLLFNLGQDEFDKIDTLPYYRARFSGSQDASSYIKDSLAVLDALPKNMPEEMARAISAKLGLTENALNNHQASSIDEPLTK